MKPDGTFSDRYLWPPVVGPSEYTASDAALQRWLDQHHAPWAQDDFWRVFKRFIPAGEHQTPLGQGKLEM